MKTIRTLVRLLLVVALYVGVSMLIGRIEAMINPIETGFFFFLDIPRVYYSILAYHVVATVLLFLLCKFWNRNGAKYAFGPVRLEYVVLAIGVTLLIWMLVIGFQDIFTVGN